MAKLREETGASKATLTRDIEFMRDFMRAPVLWNRERNGYYYDPKSPEFELPGLWFNSSELYALLAIEQLLEQVQPGLLNDAIGPLKTRIRNLLKQSGHSADTVASRIHLIRFASRHVEAEHFGAIADAVLSGHQLRFDYHGRERGEISRRQVHPYRLLHYRDNWYLIAWCEKQKDLRTFSLDRIHKIERSETEVTPTDEAQLDRHTSATFGIFTGEVREWAVLRFELTRARWVADEQWHHAQIGQWNGQHYQLQVPYSDSRELILDILKYGPEVEVIAPPELRAEVASRLHAAAQRYTDIDCPPGTEAKH